MRVKTRAFNGTPPGILTSIAAKPLFVEDAFLRSLFPARVKGEAPAGLLIDVEPL